MKRVLRLLTLAGAVVGAVWYARQHAEPEPATPSGEWTPRPQLRAVPDAEAAPEVTASMPEAAAKDDLTAIKGIGPVYAAKLSAIGIETFAALAGADPVELAAEFDPRAAVEDWISEAKDRVAT
jgi:predicted flap endonuclease-1-like 5' DNA nuclease